MLLDQNVKKVTMNIDRHICIVSLRNSETLANTKITTPQQFQDYINMLRREDDLIFGDDTSWEILPGQQQEAWTQFLRAPRMRVQCFGSFEVFCENDPIHFERKSSKEILAYLINLRGASASRLEICNAMWEDDQEIDRRRAYFRTLITSLRKTLERYDLTEVLITHRDSFAINPKLMDCDYYRFLEGDTDSSARFRGEYMSQYTWAESTLGLLVEETKFNIM